MGDGGGWLHDAIDRLCERIEETEPDLQAYVPEPDRRLRLHAEAETLLTRWPEGPQRPALLGQPLAVKDVMHVDGWVTRAGSHVDPAALTGAEATVVSRLRAAGALVVGKSVTAEFASKAPGPTRNPHDLSRTPGGSSSGSAAAVAAGTAVLATGTQTIGSVIRPAAFCGVVGFKPTHGRASIDGIIAHSPTFDTPGVFGPDVATVRAAAAVMWDVWSAVPGHVGRRLVVPVGDFLQQCEPAAVVRFRSALSVWSDAGWEVEEVDLLPDLDDVHAHNLVVNRYELARVHEPWFDTFRADYRQLTVDSIEDGRRISEKDYATSRTHVEEFRRELDVRLEQAAATAVATPAALGPAPVGIETTGNPAMALPWTYAGLPAISIPTGQSDEGLPLGVQLVGPRGADESLVELAAGLVSTSGRPSGRARVSDAPPTLGTC